MENFPQLPFTLWESILEYSDPACISVLIVLIKKIYQRKNKICLKKLKLLFPSSIWTNLEENENIDFHFFLRYAMKCKIEQTNQKLEKMIEELKISQKNSTRWKKLLFNSQWINKGENIKQLYDEKKLIINFNCFDKPIEIINESKFFFFSKLLILYFYFHQHFLF